MALDPMIKNNPTDCYDAFRELSCFYWEGGVPPVCDGCSPTPTPGMWTVLTPLDQF